MSDEKSEMVNITREELTSLLGDVEARFEAKFEAKFKRDLDEREAKIRSDMEAKFKVEMAQKLAAAEKQEAVPEAAPESEEEKESALPAKKPATNMAAFMLAAAANDKNGGAQPEAAAPKPAAVSSKGGGMAGVLLAAAKKAEQHEGLSRGNSMSFNGAARDNSQRNYDAEVDVDEIIEQRSSRNLLDSKESSARLAGVIGNMLKKPEPEKKTDLLAAAVSGLLKPQEPGDNPEDKPKPSKLLGAIGDVMHQNRVEKRGDGPMSFADVVDDVVHVQRKSAFLLRNEKGLLKAAEAFKTSKRKLMENGSINEDGSGTGSVKGDGEDDEDDDDNWHAPFGETIYTLMYMCPLNSQAFCYSLFVYILQLLTITLTLVDIIDTKIDNVLLLPPNVDLTVTVAQGVTLFIVLGYMSDLIEAVLKIQDGFYPEILEIHPGADYLTWLISCLAQLSAGLLVLVGSFILTMQASTVIDLMLNLTALLFISEIDDIGFLIAKMGFITDVLQKQTEAVADFEVPKRPNRNLNRRVLYGLTLLGLQIGYGVLKSKQLNGEYLPTIVYVQFGDAYNPRIPYFSGVLKASETRTTGYREYRDMGTKGILLSYCHTERAWTFSETSTACDYFAISLVTEDYDVSNIADSEWLVKDSIGRLQPFDTFSLVNRDCDTNICQGTCVRGLCECPHDRFGMDCEFEKVCEELVLDGRTTRFPIIYGTNFGGMDQNEIFLPAKEFELLKYNKTGEFVKVYNMPVYYSDSIFPASIIFFGGRRWVLTSEKTFLNYTALKEANPDAFFFKEETAFRFIQEFQGTWFETPFYIPYFLSDAIDYETPSFKPSPTSIGWWSVRVISAEDFLYEPDAKVETVFNCLSCIAKDDGFCGIGGSCNTTTGMCECFYGYLGKKCEMLKTCGIQDQPCFGDGECDLLEGTCTCNLPYGDKLCLGTFACFEEGGACQNGGVCQEDQGMCRCPPDPQLTGFACEKFTDCHVHGCQNGGVCALNGKCVCRPPFTGVNCGMVNETQADLLCKEDNDCMNGTCNNRTGVCECEDPYSFGSLCELGYNCTWGGCLNGGTCNEESGLCENCDAPYFGPDCGKEANCVDQASPDEYCTQAHGDWSLCDLERETCFCGWDFFYVGKKCMKNCKLEGGCHNGGKCNAHGYCECPVPYTGLLCDLIAEDVGLYTFDLERMQACIDQNGFPPYEGPNATDCRYVFPLP